MKNNDNQLIKAAKNLDSNALKELVNKYGAIYDSIVKRMNFEKNYIKDDMIADKYHFFFEMVKTFNPKKKTKFSTYIYNMTRWGCLDKLKSDKKKALTLEMDIQTSEFDLSKTSHIIDKIKTFDQRTQYIFMHRFFKSDKKTSFKQIGKELNLTYEGVRQIYIKHLDILKKIHE